MLTDHYKVAIGVNNLLADIPFISALNVRSHTSQVKPVVRQMTMITTSQRILSVRAVATWPA